MSWLTRDRSDGARIVLFAAALGMIGGLALAAQPAGSAHTLQLAAPTRSLSPAVDFLADPPVIDGVLDEAARALPERRFPLVVTAGDSAAVPSASYRLAYGSDFLYVCIQVDADRLVCRDRAYQNGDGFQLVIGRPQPEDAPTREFYVVAASAVGDPIQEWARRIIWYYNVTGLFRPLSREARHEARNDGARTTFELLLPWSDLHPYHPWLSEAIGFNLCLVKAVGDRDQIQYFVLPDGHIQQEQSPRELTRIAFAPPAVPAAAPRTFVQLAVGHATAGEAVQTIALTAAGAAVTERLSVSVRAGEGTSVRNSAVEYACGPGLTRHEFALPVGDLPAGGYRVAWNEATGTGRGEAGLTLLPAVDLASLRAGLERAGSSSAGPSSAISAGTLATMRLRCDELQARLSAAYPYETLADVRLDFDALVADARATEAGSDPLAHRTGLLRRGFLSQVDGTLQPYAIFVPADYDPAREPERRWPLLVYLHGSGMDERGFARSLDLVPAGFLAIAPRGRGTSNAYTSDHAQEDIAEAIADARANYAIDPANVMLAGFSMGGYGVYRTFWETPKKFRALAVLSGDPNIGNRYTGRSDQPNFLEPRFLKPFRNTPLFVFHGKQDRNCPYALTEQLVGKLGKAGARVTFVTEDAAGHSLMSAEHLAQLRAWLREQAGMAGEAAGPTGQSAN